MPENVTRPETAVIKPNRRGTVTIPKEFRATWEEGDIVLEVALREDGVIELRPRRLVDPAQAARYEAWQRRREAFFDRWETIARGAAVPADEAEALAQEAVRAVRQARAR